MIRENRPVTQSLQLFIQIVVNFICLITVILFIVTDNCGNFVYNGINSITAIVGGLIIAIIQTFDLNLNYISPPFKSNPQTKLPPEIHEPSPHGGLYTQRMAEILREKQRRNLARQHGHRYGRQHGRQHGFRHQHHKGPLFV